MRLKKAGFKDPRNEMARKGFWDDNDHISNYINTPYSDKHSFLPAYDAEILFEWLRGWHRDDPFRSFEIQHDGIAVFDWGPRDNAKWIEYKTSLADMLAEAILWTLKNKS